MNTGLRSVSDTALWVAMYRAMETDRPDAIFKDPFARRLAGARGEEILKALPKAISFGWPMVVRTALMDELVMRCVGEGVTSVVDLAVGLDARAYRLELPPSLRWFDVDLPGIIDHRREELRDASPRCRHEHIAADLSDPKAVSAVFEKTRSVPGPALVIAEGLLVYLTAENVKSLARAIHDEAGAQLWLIDLASPAVLKMMMRRYQSNLGAANAPMIFGPAEGTAFFTPFGWREREFRSIFHESLRLKRTIRFAPLWVFLGRLASKKTREARRRFSGVVLLERA